jgi:hypothetical protein
MAPTIRNMLSYGALRRTLFVNAHNKDDYTRHRGQVLYGMNLIVAGSTLLNIAPGAVYTSQGLRIYFDVTDGSVDIGPSTVNAFSVGNQANLPFCVMIFLAYEFSADQVAQGIDVTTAIGQSALFTLTARIVPFDVNTGAPVYNLLPLDPITLDISQPTNYTSLQNWNGPAVSAPSSVDIQNAAIQFGEIPLGYVLLGSDPATGDYPANLSSPGVSIVSYDNAFNMISDMIGQDILLPLQPTDICSGLVQPTTGTAQYQGYSAKYVGSSMSGITSPTLVRPSYGTPNPVSGSHLNSNWATYRQPNFLKDGLSTLESFRRMDVALRQWLDTTGNQYIVQTMQDGYLGYLPLQASVDAILAQFDGSLNASTNRNVISWPNGATGSDPVNHVLKEGIIPHVENTILGKIGTAEGDSLRSGITALDVALNVVLTQALGISTTRSALRNLATGSIPVNFPVAATVPTVSPFSTNNTQIANTAFVQGAIAIETTRAEAAEAILATAITTETTRAEAAEAAINANLIANYAPLASPTFTGTPTAPTPSPATLANTDIATTAFVQAAIAENPMATVIYEANYNGGTPVTWEAPLLNGSPSYFTVNLSAVAGGASGANSRYASGSSGAAVRGLVLRIYTGDTITFTIGQGGQPIGSPLYAYNPGQDTFITVVQNSTTTWQIDLGGATSVGGIPLIYTYIQGVGGWVQPVDPATNGTIAPFVSGLPGTNNSLTNAYSSGAPSIFYSPANGEAGQQGAGGANGLNSSPGLAGGDGYLILVITPG